VRKEQLEAENKTFLTVFEKSEISWIMVRPEPEPDPSADDDSTKEKSKAILVSKDFFSNMEYGWIPEHGVEFFTLFIEDLHKKWNQLFRQADTHLAKTVSFPIITPFI
jgi:hypothetical protein